MKYLIMCEGSNEKKIMDMLLENGKLKVSADDLLGRIIYHARQIKKSPMVMGQLQGKSQKHPKAYAKENITINKRRYKGETSFYEDYYGKDINKLVRALQEYKQRNHAHKSDEHYLVEILNGL